MRIQLIFLKVNNLNILLTGGLGYIGSHIAIALLEAGHQVVISDNLSNSKIETLDLIQRISGKSIVFKKGDVRDQIFNEILLHRFKIEAVIHLAGLKAVGESTEQPLSYYDNNVGGTISLLKAMTKLQVKKLVFSSSATVYGIPKYLPIDEKHPTNPENPYGKTKLLIEEFLKDIVKADSQWSVITLRYFNPAGAHPSGLIGENPNSTPNNLMPYISQVASGLFDQLSIFGDDYKTIDGTGVRDYIHIMDLAEGHLAAVEFLEKRAPNFTIINLGTGVGHSVLEMVKMYEEVSERKISYEIKKRRSGDIDACYANCDKATSFFYWKAKRNLRAMCEDSWRWQQGKKVKNES